jgi:uncharacterized membrane protein YqjE
VSLWVRIVFDTLERIVQLTEAAILLLVAAGGCIWVWERIKGRRSGG